MSSLWLLPGVQQGGVIRDAVTPYRFGCVTAPEHGGILTGHWEFDTAILLGFFALISFSFLLPVDAPRGVGRRIIQATTITLASIALILVIAGFRSLT